MTESERSELIAILMLWTSWSDAVFIKMTDDELKELHARYCN